MALPKVSLLLVAGSLLAAAAPSVASAQNITIDGRFSAAQTLTGPYYSIGANLGKQVGSNLFHSFGQFSLVKGDTAAFTATGSTAPISNVIGRVTGGNPSSIDGTIKSKITAANLFLINPSGIVFGPNATVNVSGAFHASTADYIKMADGAKFQATQPDGSTLSAAPPAAFGFLTANPAKISVNGSTLGVPPGQTLGLVGGPVSIAAASPTATTGARLAAPAGTIHVTSAAGTGEVPVDPRNTSAVTVSNFGPVDIKGKSKLDVSDPLNKGSGGSVFVRSGALTIDASKVNADNYGAHPGGQLVLQADSKIVVSNKSKIHALARAEGTGSDVILQTSPGGAISLDNSTVKVGSNAIGDGGTLSVKAGQLTLTNGAALKTKAEGSGNGGPIAVTADAVLLDGGAALDASTGIFSTTSGSGSGGSISIVAGELALHNGANALAQTSGAGTGGALDAKVTGPLTVDSRAALKSDAQGTGDGGPITVTADAILLDGDALVDQSTGVFTMFSEIFSSTSGGGRGGSITIIAGELSLHNGAGVLAQSYGTGAGGALDVKVNGPLTVNSGASLGTTASGDGNAGDVSVVVSGPVAIDMSVGARASILQGIGSLSGIDASGSQTQGRGNSGNVKVSAATLTITNYGVIGATTFDAGNAGDLGVDVSGMLSISGPSGTSQGSPTGVLGDTEPGSSGNAGKVIVAAGTLSIVNNGIISSGTFGSGDGGSVAVSVAGGLTIDGTMTPGKFTGISSQANSQANPGSPGSAGSVVISAGNLSIDSGQISSSTFDLGKAGSVTVNVAGALTIDGAMTPDFFTGIASQANQGSTGNAGNVTVNANTVTLLNDGRISTSTGGPGSAGSLSIAAGALTISNKGVIASGQEETGSGNAGSVSVTVAGPLSIDGISENTSFTGIAARTRGSGNAGTIAVNAGSLVIVNSGAISSETLGSGDGGSVTVTAANSITVSGGSRITSGTSGTGGGGDVEVRTYGPLALSGPGTEIAASATGAQSGAGGAVTVTADSLTVKGGAQIASTTAGPGKGGDVNVKVASDIMLPDGGPQITAQSSGSGNAGSITVSAVRLLMNNGAAISTEATTANGGNITLSVGDLVYLLGSKITASVNRDTGSGGNITIDPQLVVLNHSSIIAQAAEGRGGNIRINAGAFIQSADSSVDASSEKGISGTVVITGPRVDVNGALVVLSSELRGHAAVLREACAARSDRPVSSLVEAGRGGLPQDPETTLPALYIADRDLSPNPAAGAKTEASSAPLQTTVRLTMHCG